MATSGRRQDYESLKQELLKARALFADPQFPPQNSSISRTDSQQYTGRIFWKRPSDLIDKPKFLVKGAKRHELDQGILGNCWFIAGAALFASSQKKLFSRVVPPDQGFEEGQYTGMFRFNFWWFGKWVEVIIDDYLPTDGRRPIYCRNKERPSEFWPCLLEKAYAKLYGSYEALDGGKIQDAMVDMTGGISEVINIQEKSAVSPDLYDLLYKSHQMKSMIGASIFRPKNSNYAGTEMEKLNGLFMGHSYTVTGFYKIPSNQGTVQLLRLRNPWGRGEWRGAWSDHSAEMTYLQPELRDQLRFANKTDGEFWISLEDFIFEFDEIELCHLQPDAFTAENSDTDDRSNWNVTVYHDAWIKDVTAGGCGNAPHEKLYWKNPQFFVTLETPDNTLSKNGLCTLIVSLMEKEHNNQGKVAVGFDVYKLNGPDRMPLDDSRAPRDALLLTRRSGQYVYYREVTKRFELQPGTYAIIPSTFHPHEESEFMIRLFTEKRVESGVLDEHVDQFRPISQSSASSVDNAEETFLNHAGKDQSLDAMELSGFIADMSRRELETTLVLGVEASRSLLILMDESKSGFLNLAESKRAWKEVKAYRDVFKRFDKDNSDKIDSHQLDKLFSTIGFPINRSLMGAIQHKYGGRYHKISMEDFMMMTCKLTSLFASFHRQSRSTGIGDDIAHFTRNEFLEMVMSI